MWLPEACVGGGGFNRKGRKEEGIDIYSLVAAMPR